MPRVRCPKCSHSFLTRGDAEPGDEVGCPRCLAPVAVGRAGRQRDDEDDDFEDDEDRDR
jgi:hypothetical protein